MSRLISFRFIVLGLVLAGSLQPLKAGTTNSLSGKVTDPYGHPLHGAVIQLFTTRRQITTNNKGEFQFRDLNSGTYNLEVRFVGYKTAVDSIAVTRDTTITLQLQASENTLREFVINGSGSSKANAENSLSNELADRHYLEDHAAGSLMETLSRIPGVGSLDIGAAQSKPVIRGLSFNRVLVTENNVLHQAQEWGADHGLEIDPFAVDQVTVIKGPASLLYGSGGIGGIVSLENRRIPGENLQGEIQLRTRTVNDLYSVSTRLEKRFRTLYFKGYYTFSEYADYKVPADSIEYLSYNIRLKDKRIRNTAGNEHNAGLQIGFLGKNIISRLTVSDNFTHSGFFANAHGLEIRNSAIDYDRSNRDIDLPSQKVNHLKILNNTVLQLKEYELSLDLGFQHNHREEFSEALAHGYMPVPPDSMERLYDKKALSGTLRVQFPMHSMHAIQMGISGEYTHNSIGGWGFILPAYELKTGGLFAHDLYRINAKWTLEAGIRTDYGSIRTHAYRDWYKTPANNGGAEAVLRATNLRKSYGNASFGLGVIHNSRNMEVRMHLGKSFRMPAAQELANNGINYHMFRYEKGTPNLRAEESWQADFGINIHRSDWEFECTPFVNYFPNYLYLNPSADYEEGQQIYYYTQSRVFRAGGETALTLRPAKGLELHTDLEYVFSRQLSGSKTGYTLPFSPPLTTNIELNWLPPSQRWQSWRFRLGMKWAAAQNQIVPPEKKTPSWYTLDGMIQKKIPVRKQPLSLRLLVNNILNRRYYDHTSFYRLIEVPAPGRNFTCSVQYPLTF